ncbi:MAG: sodium-dependent transporter [Sutterella sp.]|nr:sodium-dependent transporter [Sutterella sp.]
MTERSQWGSRLGFILASAGSAVGLGAIWKFPYLAGTNGGSVFMLPYIFFTITIGLVLLMGEMCMGRAARAGAAGAFRRWAGSYFAWIGKLSVLTGYLVLAFYSVVGGWCVYYMVQAFLGNGIVNNPAMMRESFGAFASSGLAPVLAHLAFLSATALVVLFGVEKGIERISKVLMPLLFIMMLVLIVRGLTLPGAMKGVEFLFKPDFKQFTGSSLLNAMGFAFFSLSVGSASQMNYGSYLSNKVNLPTSVSWIVFLAIIASLLGGLMIMPAVFAFGLSPDAGPGLTFATMPAVFAQLPFGHAFAITFYVCLFVAALTSSISIFEMSVQYLVDEWKITRAVASALCFVSLAILGVLCALSFGPLANVKVIGFTFFDFFDYLTSNIGMPIGVLGIGLVVGWLARPMAETQLQLVQPYPQYFLTLFHLIAGFVAPVLIIIVMLKGLGVF